MSACTKRTIRRSVRAVLASVAVTAVAFTGAAGPASAAPMAMTLSSVFGPTGGGNTLVGSITPNAAIPAPFPAATTPVVQFQYIGTGSASCTPKARAKAAIAVTNTTATAGVLAADAVTVKRVTAWKLVFKVPSSTTTDNPLNAGGLVLGGTQTQAKWAVCVYDSDNVTTSTLLATAMYTIALKPTITSISPASSPAAGGQTITVNGTGFTPVTTPITASAGGVALTNIKVAANGNSFTATTGPRAAGDTLPLTVTAPGGTVSSLDPDNDVNTNNPIHFAYSNGITISPNTGVVDTKVTIDVVGAGFSALTFDTNNGATPASSNAHIFLVDGEYLPASNRGVAECIVGAVVSDTQLVCDLDLAADRLNPLDSTPLGGTAILDGAYILTVVANGSTGAGSSANPSIISSGAAFVVGPY